MNKCVLCGGTPSAPPERNAHCGDSEHCSICGKPAQVRCIVCGGKGYILSGTICIICGCPIMTYQHCYSCNGTGWVPHLCLGL